eukprot:2606706-Prymnesium_polylepis.1
MTCEHRGRGVGPSWACAALSKLPRVCLTPSARLLSISLICVCVSGRDVREREGARAKCA